MTGYSFWCSKCKKDHAGECQPKVGFEVTLMLGTRWHPDVRVGGGEWEPVAHCRAMTVLKFDGLAKTVTYEYDDDLTTFTVSTDIFGVDGIKSNSGNVKRIRFVRRAPDREKP